MQFFFQKELYSIDRLELLVDFVAPEAPKAEVVNKIISVKRNW